MAEAYVKTELHPDLPPPTSERGIIGWLHHHLFSTWYNSIATVIILYLIYLTIPPLLDWTIFSSVWDANNFKECKANGTGACWAMIAARFNLFIYGFYDADEFWRPNLAFVLFMGAMLPVMFDKLPGRGVCAIFLIFVYPAVAIALIHGPVEMSTMQTGLGKTIWGLAFVGGGVLGWYSMKQRNPGLTTLGFGISYCVAFVMMIAWGFGVPVMETSNYGGLLLTLILACVAIAVSLPLGIILALGRRANSMPVVQLLCIGFIELVRSVPLITVLFMAQFMLPLFLPEGMNFDNVVRALVGVSLFAAAYMAEVVRGGLQAIPKGQFEAADSLGLNYYLNMRLIILPQALKIVIPGIVGNFIGLFKDTTLVSIIGLMDLLGVGKASIADQKWLGLEHEAYFFVALTFFIFCFGMSRYSMYLENKLHTGHKR